MQGMEVGREWGSGGGECQDKALKGALSMNVEEFRQLLLRTESAHVVKSRLNIE